MTLPAAALFLSVAFGADELGTRQMLHAGGRETMIERPLLRIGIKVAVLPLYLHEQKKSRLVRYGFPVVFLAAAGWNVHVARQMGAR